MSGAEVALDRLRARRLRKRRAELKRLAKVAVAKESTKPKTRATGADSFRRYSILELDGILLVNGC